MSNENETPNTNEETSLEDAVVQLLDVGRLWANHGLKVAQMAVTTSARTLEATAEVLDEVSQRFEPTGE